MLLRLAALMGEREDDLASLMVLEQGKPLAEARAEIAYAASFYEWFAEEAKRLDGSVIPSPWSDKRILATREPVGVTAGITPWNFPSAMVTRKSAPALAVGCTMILKPAEQTPLSALARRGARGGGGRPGRRLLRRDGRRGGRACHRRGADLEPARAQARLHGLDGDREAPDAAVRRPGEEGLARARRERAVHRLRRRRPRRRDRVGARLQVPQLGPDVHLREPDARPDRDLRRVPRAIHRRGAGSSSSPTGSRTASRWAR